MADKTSEAAKDRARVAELDRKIKMSAKLGFPKTYRRYVAERQEVLGEIEHKIREQTGGPHG